MPLYSLTTVTAESVPSAKLVHTKFYGYGEICSIGAADAHETLSSGLAAVIQRHIVGYARKSGVVHLPTNLWNSSIGPFMENRHTILHGTLAASH